MELLGFQVFFMWTKLEIHLFPGAYLVDQILPDLMHAEFEGVCTRHFQFFSNLLLSFIDEDKHSHFWHQLSDNMREFFARNFIPASKPFLSFKDWQNGLTAENRFRFFVNSPGFIRHVVPRVHVNGMIQISQ